MTTCSTCHRPVKKISDGNVSLWVDAETNRAECPRSEYRSTGHTVEEGYQTCEGMGYE